LHGTLGAITKNNVDDPFSKNQNPAISKEFHDIFKLEERLIAYYSCSHKGGDKGKLYITPKHVCFYSNAVGKVTEKVLTWDHIVSIEKMNTARLIPNAMEIRTIHGKKLVFQSFVNRDQCFDILEGELKKFRLKRSGPIDSAKPALKTVE